MAVELKNAADRYVLLEKENKASSAELEKARNAAKEMRTEIRSMREELQQADKIVAGGSYLLRTKFLDPKYAPLDGPGVLQTHMWTWQIVQLTLPSSSRIKVIRKWRSFSSRNSMLPLARCR